jgi:hypothetical protein
MNKDFTKAGAPLADLEAAWQDRLADTEAFFAAGRTGSAMASALYALEIRLKVLICKKLELEQLPQAFEIHHLPGLLLLAGLSARIERRGAARVKKNWDEIKNVGVDLNDLRYTPASNWTHQQAAALLSQLRDPPHGVLLWLGKQR